MGEAKRRASEPVRIVYHHTSTLRTNLMWMSGVIELEGQSKGALHPQLGEIQTDVLARRACADFPPLAWFSSSIVIPKCLLDVDLVFQKKDGTCPVDLGLGVDRRILSNGLALNRMALGFPIEGSSIIPWKEHYGYRTNEGVILNESARDAGDDPDRWYVSEAPVDIMRATEIWVSRSKFKPKLENLPSYLKDVHRMVRTCREHSGVYIPPSWLTPEEAEKFATKIRKPIMSGGSFQK